MSTNKYIDGGIGFPVFRGPYLQQDARMAALLFAADYDKLAKLCKQYLIAPTNEETMYVPVLPAVMLVFADMWVSSLDPRDQQVGRISETEVSFWILTAAMRKVGGVFVPHHLAWFHPYLFVDESNAVATGREVYGFNKLAAQINKPLDMRQPEFAVDVLGFKQFAPDAQAQQERLLEVRQSSLGEEGPQWQSWEEAKADLDSTLQENVKRAPKNLLVEFGTRVVNQNIPFVFLKQFRHAANPDQAVYQAIIEAPIKFRKFHHGGFLSGKYHLHLNHLDSHPLHEKLGLKLKDGTQQALVGLSMQVDFELGLGKQIWPKSK